jgi:branched-subunit amino acid aminotransferase/4-amino-4-deoxychorismate lyase
VKILALAVTGRGLVEPEAPVLRADDEALLRGRAAFETLRIYCGVPFRIEQHLDRLAFSSAAIGLPPVDRAALGALAAAALAAAGVPDAVLRLFWTPGPEEGSPTGLALVSPLPEQHEALRARGMRVASLLGVRAEAPWLLPGVKSTSYAVNMAADAEAKRRGADDAVFVDTAGTVLEGPVTNVWWRRGSTLFTPSLDLGILAGVTRAALLEAAPGLGYRVEEGAFPLAALAAAEEAFTSSSVREVMPVVELDGAPVGDGRPGPAAAALQQALRVAAGAVDDQVG